MVLSRMENPRHGHDYLAFEENPWSIKRKKINNTSFIGIIYCSFLLIIYPHCSILYPGTGYLICYSTGIESSLFLLPLTTTLLFLQM